jgi:integrase
MPKLTKKRIEQAQSKDRPYRINDDALSNFYCMIHSTGRKVFYVYYRTESRQERRCKIGDFETFPLEAARGAAKDILARVRLGEDPVKDKKMRREEQTLGAITERFLYEHVRAKRKKSTAVEYERLINKHINPRLGTKTLSNITREDVARLHQGLRDTPYQANRVRAILSAIFNWANQVGSFTGECPTKGIEKNPEKTRERYLSRDEFARLARALDAAESTRTEPQAAIDAIRLLALTGCRKNEIQKLRWDEVDLLNRCLRLGDTKTGARVVPLCPPAVIILDKLHDQDHREHVFPGRHGSKPFDGVPKVWERIRKNAALEGVRLHDLRHSFASVAINSGLPLYTVSKMLGHSQASTTQRYAHLADENLRAAIDQSGELVDQFMNGSAVPASDTSASPKIADLSG